MRRHVRQTLAETDNCADEGFGLAIGHAEARRQLWVCGALCGIILAALLAAALAGTA